MSDVLTDKEGNELYMVLEVFSEVPHFKTYLLPEDEAEEKVKDFCNEYDEKYNGIGPDSDKYWGVGRRHFIQARPAEPGLSFGW